MKKTVLALFTLALVASSLQRAQAQSITEVIGAGPDFSYLVLEAADFNLPEPLIFEWRYTFEPTTVLDSYDLFVAIDAAVEDLEFFFINYGSEVEPNYILDAVTYQSVTLTNTAVVPYSPSWTQWVSGGVAGFPTPAPIASGAWTYGSGLSFPWREIAPGSWDGIIYNDGMLPPSVAPIPEPAGMGLLALATLVSAAAFFRRRLMA